MKRWILFGSLLMTGCQLTLTGPISGKSYWTRSDAYCRELRESWVEGRATAFPTQIVEGRIAKGMSLQECRVAWNRWPSAWEHVHSQKVSTGDFVQTWRYGDHYVHIRNGLVESYSVWGD